MAEEPLTEAAVAEWIERANVIADPFAHIYAASESHREVHGCDAFPSGSGPLLSMLVSIARPKRIIEVGTGLGYSAMLLAAGAPDAMVETVEHDQSYAELAEANIREAGLAGRVSVLRGPSAETLARLNPTYDFAFFDGDPDTCLDDLAQFERLVPPGGVVVSSNLFLARYVPDAPWVPKLTAYRERLRDASVWKTVFLGKALSIRQ